MFDVVCHFLDQFVQWFQFVGCRFHIRDLQGVRIAKGDKITDVYLNTRADGHIMHRNSCTNVNGWDTDAYLLAFSYKKGTDPAVSKNILEWFIGYGSYVRNAHESIFDSYTKKYKVIRWQD